MISTVVPVGELVAEQPARARVFERLGLDYCCGGRRPLADACAAKRIDLNTALRDLELCDEIVAAGRYDRECAHRRLHLTDDRRGRTALRPPADGRSNR